MKGFAVLGLGRSGTAYLMEALQQSGCFVGQVNWAYENPEVRRVNDEIFKYERGADMSSLPYGRIAPIPISKHYVAEAQGVIEELTQGCGEANASTWVLKDPRTTLLTSLWDRHVDAWIGIFRDPEYVVASYIDQGFINCKDDRGMMIAYWKEFNRVLLDLFDKQPKPTYLLHFDETIDRQIETLAKALKLPGRAEKRFEVMESKSENLAPVEDADAIELYRQLKDRVLGKKSNAQRVSAGTRARGTQRRRERV